MEDSYLHIGMRKQLVEEIQKKHSISEQVVNALLKVPRHLFLPSIFLNHAYEDKAFPIGEEQTISHPSTVAIQSSLLDIQKEEKVLEIGTGSGYQCAVLLELGARVYSIERVRNLFKKTQVLLKELNYHPKLFCGDGSKGLESFAPYDKIIVTAGAPIIPNTLIDQLKVGGKLIIPVGDNTKQKMILLEKKNEKVISKKEYKNFSFVPLVGENGWSN